MNRNQLLFLSSHRASIRSQRFWSFDWTMILFLPPHTQEFMATEIAFDILLGKLNTTQGVTILEKRRCTNY